MKRLLSLLVSCLLACDAFARAGGGCFDAGTPVRTPRGDVAIEQLNVGDTVVGGRVEALYRVEPEEFLVIPGGIRVTPGHPFQVEPGVFRTAECVFPDAPREAAAGRSAYNLLVSPDGTYIAGGYPVHNKGCFLPETPVLRDDRTPAAISDVRVGDRLLAFDTDGRLVATTVRRVITHEVDGYLVVRTAGVTLHVTREHPFYVGAGTFRTIEALRVGDKVYAYDGEGISPQPITAIETISRAATVYNLQTDAPNTYFASGIAVHNKGGFGGGGFGGGGFSSSRYRGGGSSHGDSNVLGLLITIAVLYGLCQLFSYLNDRKSRVVENLDYCFSRSTIEKKSLKTLKLLEFIARVDSTFAPDDLGRLVRDVFTKVQQYWSTRDSDGMKPLLMDSQQRQFAQQLAMMSRSHELNIIADLAIEGVDLVNVRYTHDPVQREFTALITARARDYYVDDRSRRFLRGDKEAQRFQEFWTFQLVDGRWLLREIEQTRESDALRNENFFEQFTDQGLADIYGTAAKDESKPGPWLEKDVELKATRIERLLNFLVRLDHMWNRDAMLERARSIFLSVHEVRQGGDPIAVTGDGLFPVVTSELRCTIANLRKSGLFIEYRNLCVRKVELVHVRNCRDNAKDEYTVRISAHAQTLVYKNGAIISSDEYVKPFIEYWTFGRHEGEWKLKEIRHEATGRMIEQVENIDEDSSPDQLQWYYTKPRAN